MERIVSATIIVLIILFAFYVNRMVCNASHDAKIRELNAKKYINPYHGRDFTASLLHIPHNEKTDRYADPTILASAVGNNTLVFGDVSTYDPFSQRPGSAYHINVYNDPVLPPSFTVKLLYTPECTMHPLTMLFGEIAKQWTSDETLATANVGFAKEIVSPTTGMNLGGGFPRLIKEDPYGRIATYTGPNNYGSINDWILDDRMW